MKWKRMISTSWKNRFHLMDAIHVLLISFGYSYVLLSSNCWLFHTRIVKIYIMYDLN